MSNPQIETVVKLIETAQTNLKSAQSLLSELKEGKPTKSNKKNNEPAILPETESSGTDEEGKVIEGVFDGQTMIDAEGRKYPVPANYASKSKLVAGDILKLTIQDDGRFIYKQIGPVDRKTVIGILEQEGNHFQVKANDKKYNVLLASVTYFKANNGDEVTIIIPANEESDWACIENVLSTD
ncbi:MAG: hypothetical protein WC570_02800 [Patescibacteria group bacterium]